MSEQERISDPAEIRHTIGATGTFTLRTVAGDVEMRGTDGEEVVVRAESASGRNAELPLTVLRSDGGLRIEVHHRDAGLPGFGRRGDASVDFEIEVPRGARIDLSAVSSDVHASNLSGEQSYRTVSGDMRLKAGGGRVSATAVSGDFEIESTAPLALNVTTTSGDVALAAPLIESLQLKSVSGDAEIRAAFAAGTEHSVETVSGDVAIEALGGLTVEIRKAMDAVSGKARARTVGDGSARLRFRSLSGDVQLKGSDESDASVRESRASMQAPPPPPAAPPPAALASPAPPAPPAVPAPPAPPAPRDDESMEILRALERGEIDVEEATQRLEGAGSRG